MTKVGKRTITILGIIAAALALCMVVLAITTKADEVAAVAAGEAIAPVVDNLKNVKAIAAAAVIGVVAAVGAIGMAWAITKSIDGIARQPEAEGKIRTSLMLGLVFIETAIIYALIVAILIIFVL
ncbi:MAG: ATP synthase F0 subunit C [Lachnospiraceae bacterium]|nr:ATP synthase F0 subunit C [Lachnospiraceae bacterium]